MMGLFEHFPYTNFHELNLGWFLDKFKALLAEWGIYQPIFEGIRDEAEAAAADAAEALAAAETAQGAAETALAQANTAITTANTAVTEAQTARDAAEAAQTGAEAARAGAETAQAGAEAALADAVTAKNAAVAAQNAAEDAQTAAETAQAGAEAALADTVTAKNAAVAAQTAAEAAQTAAEDAADRAEAAVAVDVEIRVAHDETNDEIDTTQDPVIVNGTYLDLVDKLQAGTLVKIRVYSNSDVTSGTPAVRKIHQHIYTVTAVSLTMGLIGIPFYYWTGNPSSTSKSYAIMWNSSSIHIAPVQ